MPSKNLVRLGYVVEVLEVAVPAATLADLAKVPKVVEVAEAPPMAKASQFHCMEYNRLHARAVAAVPARSPSAHYDPPDSELFA